MFQQKTKELTLEDILAKVYAVSCKLVNETYSDSNQTFLVFILEVLIYSVFDLSIYFQPLLSTLWDSAQVSQLISFCSIINPTNYISSSIINTIAQILVIVLIVLSIIFLAFIVFEVWEKKVVSMFCIQIIRLLRILTVPLTQLLLFNFSCGDLCKDSNSVIKPFSMIALALMVLVVTLYQRFYYLPLKRNNLYYRVGSDFQTYEYLLTIVKLLVFASGSLQYTYFFFFGLGNLAVLEKHVGCMNSQTRYLHTTLSYLNLLTCIVVLLNWAFNNGDILFYVWVLCVVSFLVATIIRYVFNMGININNFSKCTDASPDIFLELMDKLNNIGSDSDKVHLLTGFLAVHCRSCEDPTCYLIANRHDIENQMNAGNGSNERSETAQALQKITDLFINNFLMEKSKENQLYAIIYYVRLYEFGRFETIRKLQRTITALDYQYARTYIFKLMDSDDINEDYQITEENYVETKQVFYKQLKSVNAMITKFMSELKYKEARLSIVEDYGYQSCIQIEELRKLFDKITRNNRLDFKIIELYLEFVTNFLRDKNYSEEVIVKLKKKAKNSFDDFVLEQSSQPTIEINRKDEAKIMNINAEAIKYFGCHRIQMLEKNLFSFLMPEVPPEKYEELFNSLGTESLVCLARTRRNTIFPVRIMTRIKDLSNRKQFFVEFMVLRKLSSETFIMVNQSFEAQFFSDREIVLKGSQLEISGIYESNIKPLQEDLIKNKMAEIEIDNGIAMNVRLENSLADNSYFLYIEFSLLSDGDGTQRDTNLSNINTTSNNYEGLKFNFLTDGNNKIMYECMPVQREWEWTQEESVKATQVDEMMISRAKVDYSRGIKSYRLEDDIIYNIELEDKNAGLEEFEEQKERVELEEQKRKRKVTLNVLYIVAGVICALYFAAIVVKIVYEVSATNSLRNQYSKFIEIEVYQLKFFRMAGVLRDGLQAINYQNNVSWNDQLLLTFNQIQASQKTQLFSNRKITISLNGTVYSSYLDEICNILLSRMYNLARFQNTAGADELLKVISEVIVPSVRSQKFLLSQSMTDSLSSLVTYEIAVFVVHIFLCLLMFIVIVVISLNETEAKKGMLMCYGMMPDHQIQSYLERLVRFEYLIIMAEKNEDVEIHNSLEDKTNYGKRQAPKKYISKLSQHSKLMILQGFIILLNVVIFYFIITASQQVVSTLQEVLRSNKQLANIYGGFMQVAAEKISNVPYVSHLDEVKQSLVDFERTKSTLPYTQSFADYLNNVLFGNSCDIVSGWLMGLPCYGFVKGFSLGSPFNEGLAYYLQAMYLFLEDSILEIYPCTGLMSLPFQKVFEQISFRSQSEWESSITIASQQAYANTVFHILEFMALCLIILITYNNNDSVKQKIAKICTLIKSESVSLESKLLNTPTDTEEQG